MSRRRRGFTLIELILATSIFALIAVAALAFLDGSRRLDERIQFKAEVYQTGRAVLHLIERDLRGAFASGGKFGTGIVGSEGSGEGGDADEIELVSVNHKPYAEEAEGLHEIDLTRTIYRLDAQTGLSRVKITRLTAQETLDLSRLLQPVSARVTAVNFRYHDGAGWLDGWDTAATRTMPRAVEVAVTVSAEFLGKTETETLRSAFWLPIGSNWKPPPDEDEYGPGQGQSTGPDQMQGGGS